MSHGDEARSFGSYGFLSALNIAPLWAEKELWEIRKLVYLSDGIMMGESIVVFNIYGYASYYIWHDLTTIMLMRRISPVLNSMYSVNISRKG